MTIEKRKYNKPGRKIKPPEGSGIKAEDLHYHGYFAATTIHTGTSKRSRAMMSQWRKMGGKDA